MALKSQLEAQINRIVRLDRADEPALLEIAHFVREKSLHGATLDILKDHIKYKNKAGTQARALVLLSKLVAVGNDNLFSELATKKWMDRILKVIIKSKEGEEPKQVALQNLSDWSHRFQQDSQYSEFTIAVQRLRAKNYTIPPPGPNSVPGHIPPPRNLAGTVVAPRGGSGTMTRTQLANAGNVDTLVQQIQADVRKLEYGLQDPSVLPASGIMDICKRHRNKIVLMLQTDIKEDYASQLIALNEQITEFLEIGQAICEAENLPGTVIRNSMEPSGAVSSPPSRAGGSSTSHNKSPSPKSRSAGPDDDDDDPVDSEELKKLQQELEAAKDSKRKVEEKCDSVRQKINDVRVQLQMTSSPSTDDDTKAKQFKTMLHGTTKNSRRVLMQAQEAVRKCRNELSWIRGQAQQYMAEFESDLNRVHEMAEKMTKQESKGFELLKKQYLNEMQMRKKLYNKIQEFRGNTRIYCRARPVNAREKGLPDGGGDDIVQFPTPSEVLLKDSGKPKIFEVDHSYKPVAKNSQVFEDAAPVITCAIDGCNVAMFCYGQSGSGKTYTLYGNEKDPGILYLGLKNLWDTFKERWETEKTHVLLSVMELNGDHLKDVIDNSKVLNIQKTETALFVENLTELECIDENDAMNKAKKHAESNPRSATAAQIVFLRLVTENIQTGTQTNGKLYFVELPGSERNDKMCGALGNVLEKLLNNAKADQIPFKSSKLTSLLQDCVGGVGKQFFFLNFSAARASAAETTSTLQFGFKVRGVILGG